LGNPLDFRLTAGQVSDISAAKELLLSAGVEKKYVLADKGYDCDALIEAILLHGGKAVIPWRSNRRESPTNRECDWHLYKERHLVECQINKMKHFRRISTRYEKLASSFLAMLYIVGTLIWLR